MATRKPRAFPGLPSGRPAALLPCRLAALIILLALAPSPLAAQIPQDTLQRDSVLADTVDQTARFLEAQAQANIRLPVLPLVGVEGPRPALTRVVMTRDTLDWALAETLGDLLQRIPGVFLWRQGWLGRPEYANYQGRGATAVEYRLDGLPFLPMGPDSVGVDPAFIPLILLDRVEVERWPGLLRVHLFTRRNDRRAARSLVGIASGDRDITRYQGLLERRFANGLGFSAGGEFFDAPSGTGFQSGTNNTYYWVQASYIPSPRFGVTAQVFRQSPDRRAFERVPGDTIGPPLRGDRSDEQVRIFFQPEAGERGLRLDLLYGHTAWKGEGVEQSLDHVGGSATWRTGALRLGGSLFHRSRWTSLDARAEAGWTGPAGLTLSGEAVHQRHDHDRTSSWWGGRAGLALPLGFRLSGSARIGSVVAAPAIQDDQPQDLTDLQALLGWQGSRLGFEAGLAQTDRFRPFAFQPYFLVDSLRPVPEARWFTFHGRVAPRQWLTIEGWYSDPMGTAVDGLPPKHSAVTGTIRSKFLRQFPSGIFDLKLQMGVEAWSSGVIGVDAAGAPIKRGGATFFRTMIEVKIGSLLFFWDRMNILGVDHTWVPGYPAPRFLQTFGARWAFLN